MAYDLRIYRAASAPVFALPIQEDEWKIAVSTTSGVRLVDSTPLTAKQLPSWADTELYNQSNLDAEILFPQRKVWLATLHWRGEDAAFKANALRMKNVFFGILGIRIDTNCPVWKVVSQLAEKLGAVIEGDDGERYDLHTGQLIPESRHYR